MTKGIQGFSLIELMITMTLLTGIGLVLARTSIDGLQTFSIVQTKQNTFSAFLELFTRIDKNVRIAVEFPPTYTAPSGATYTAGSTTLIMKLKGLSGIGTAECEGFDYLVYDLQGNTLHEIVVAASDSARSSHDQFVFVNLENIAFTQTKTGNEHRTVEVVASFIEKSQTRSVTQTHSQTMVARND